MPQNMGSVQVPCVPGTFADVRGLVECKKCPAGFHQDKAQQTKCKPCPEGFVQPNEGSARCVACHLCKGAGQQINPDFQCNRNRKHQTQATCECKAGWHKKRGHDPNAADACNPCREGNVSPVDGAENKCTACTPGKYQDETTKLHCKLCPAGKFQDQPVAFFSQSTRSARTRRIFTAAAHSHGIDAHVCGVFCDVSTGGGNLVVRNALSIRLTRVRRRSPMVRIS